MSLWSGLLDRKWKVSSTAGLCIAGVQLQNCVSERNLEQHANALSRQKETMELTHVSTAATGMQAKVAILEIQLAQPNDEVTLRLFEALETSDGVQMDTCEDGMLNCGLSLSLLMVYYAGNMHLDQQQRLSLCLYYLNLCNKRLYSSVTTPLELDIEGLKRP